MFLSSVPNTSMPVVLQKCSQTCSRQGFRYVRSMCFKQAYLHFKTGQKLLNKWASILYLSKHSVPKGSWCSCWEVLPLVFQSVTYFMLLELQSCTCVLAIFLVMVLHSITNCTFLAWKLNSSHQLYHCLHRYKCSRKAWFLLARCWLVRSLMWWNYDVTNLMPVALSENK